MAETPQQYTQRILGHAKGQDPVKVQSATEKKLARLIKNLSSAKLRKRPASGKWSVAEILAHLADAELVIAWRLRSILAAPGIEIQAFDQDAWEAAGKYNQRDPRKSIELFGVVRGANLALIKSLSPAQRKHHGQHAERGRESIEHIVALMAGHDLNHIRQIESIVQSAK